MIEILQMSRWDQQLEQKDYQSIIKLVLCSYSLKKARLHFPSQPPDVEKEVLGDLVIYDKTVEWIIGPKLIQTLNMETFKWEVTVQTTDVHSTALKQTSAAEAVVVAHVENYFVAEKPEHLTISVGDIITDITLVRYGWWQGEVNGKRGRFPCNNVKVVILNPSKPAARTRGVNGQVDTGLDQTDSTESERKKKPSTSFLLGKSTSSIKPSVHQGTNKRKGSDTITQAAAPVKKLKGTSDKEGEATKQDDYATPDENGDLMKNLHKEQFIGKEGGILFLHEADVSLNVPPGALKDGCVIHVTVPLDPRIFCPDNEVFPRTTPLIICEPDNLHFDVPVTLTLPHCAVLNNSRNHSVDVLFGHKTGNNSKEWTWMSETVEHSLGEQYCSLLLSHFCGVNVIIGSVESKILRLIPYTKFEPSGKQVLTVWLCNDLEPDFKSVMQSEEKNKGLPLDSYDTFRLRCVSGSENKVNVHIEVVEGSNWRPQDSNTEIISVERPVTSSKTNCTFRLISDAKDDGKYMYFLLRVTQGVGKKKTETAFALRKRICDLKMPVNFMKPISLNNKTSHLYSTDTEASLRPYTAVVYMDPVNHFKDDVIITLWLWPFDSTTEVFKELQKEQELQYRHQVHTENSFSIVDKQPDVVTKTQLLNGHWVLSPSEMKIETDRIRFGSRAKFQFIGERGESNETACIDLRVETYQVGEDTIKFMTEVELIQLLFERRQKEIERMKASSASKEYSNLSFEDQSNNPFQSNQVKLLPSTSSAVIDKERFQSKQMQSQHYSFHPSVGHFPLGSHPQDTITSQDDGMNSTFGFLSRQLGKDWLDVGRELGVSEADLDNVKRENDVTRNLIYAMLMCWKQRKGFGATYGNLIMSLEKAGRKDLADELQRRSNDRLIT